MCYFLCGRKSLVLLTVPKFIEFAKNLARDNKALSEMKMNRTAASYKLVDGLKVYERKKSLMQ